MNTRQLFLIIIIGIAILYVMLFTFVIVWAVQNKKSGGQEEKKRKEKISFAKSQTDFYRKSSKYAVKVLYGEEFLPEFGDANFFGKDLLNLINKLNEQTKSDIVLSMKYFSTNPVEAKTTERVYRSISATQGVPLWYVILSESVKKVIPEFKTIQPINSQNADPEIICETKPTSQPKIIKLHATA